MIRPALISALLRCLARLPLPLRRRLGRFLGGLLARWPMKERRIARCQMDLFVPAEGGSTNLVPMFCWLGETFMETINLQPLLEQLDECVDCSDHLLLNRLRSGQQPAVILTAHTGNWDLGAAAAVQWGVELSVIGREARGSGLQDGLERIRAGYGVKTLWRRGALAPKAVIRELRSGRSVAALIDQDTEVGSEFAPFFGRSAKCPSGLVELAKRFNAILLSAFVFRLAENRYTLVIEELDSELSTGEILTEYNRRLENLVREHPEQWVWIHKRWRTQEDGTRLSSKEYLAMLESELLKRCWLKE